MRIISNLVLRSIPILAVLLALTGAALAGDNWPDYRGPSRDGHAGKTGIPLKWSETESVKWKTPIYGRAWSSPIIQDGVVWMTTATADGRHLYVIGADPETGYLKHNFNLFNVDEPQFVHEYNTHSSPSPVSEPGRVYIEFGAYGTACLDTGTAEIIWQRRDIYTNHFRGAGSSPFLYKDLLILTRDGSDFQYVIALNKHTGETVWKTDRTTDFKDIQPDGKPSRDGDFRKGFSTPHIVTHNGKDQLISAGAKACYAYDPMTGKELWHFLYDTHSSSSRTVVGHGLAFINTGLGKPELWAVKPDVLIEGRIYMTDDSGIATCLDAVTGKEIWKDRIGGAYSASPIYTDGRIYFFDEIDKSVVIEPGDKLKVLAENHLDDGAMGTPAIMGNALFIRTKTHLYRIEN
ncbi:MAG: outer membrane protein assembly factor BamB family protein [Planctomycetota bacterium]|jgi:outer membrane protein assembly factor BamB